MSKRHIITVAGKPGSGKSSVARLVAEKLGYTHFSSGDFMRDIAHERGMTLAELQKIAESDPSIDTHIDETLRGMRDKEDIVIDSRLAFHWIPLSFKVYLELDLHTAAERIAHDQTKARIRSGESADSAEDIYAIIHDRLESERERYTQLYGIDHTDTSQFDLVVDTKTNPLEQVVASVLEGYNRWCEE